MYIILPRALKVKRGFLFRIFFHFFFALTSLLRNLIPRHSHQPFYIPVQPVQRLLARPSLRRNLNQLRPAAAFAQFFFQYFSYFHSYSSFLFFCGFFRSRLICKTKRKVNFYIPFPVPPICLS